jgi:carbamoyl-phosphate synthase small subunit
LDQFLKRHGVVGIAGVDTRALTRKLRTAGVMMGAISTDETVEQARQRIRESPDYGDLDFVRMVSTPDPYEWKPKGAPDDPGDRLKIVCMDYGIRASILRNLWEQGCRAIVMPCQATAEEVLEEKPDGVLLSPGPGDPRRLDYAVSAIRGLLGKVPVFGICLGSQLLGCSLGGKLYKLKFGHRGGNHPVRDEITGRIKITSQNHGYALDIESLKQTKAMVSQVNLNDGTVEGLECPELRAFSIQYHAEASPGPMDSRGIFKQFVQRIREPERWREIVAEVW